MPKNQCSVISCQFCLVFNSIWFRFVSFSLARLGLVGFQLSVAGQQTNDRFMAGNQTQDHKYLNLWGLYTTLSVWKQSDMAGIYTYIYISIYIYGLDPCHRHHRTNIIMIVLARLAKVPIFQIEGKKGASKKE